MRYSDDIAVGDVRHSDEYRISKSEIVEFVGRSVEDVVVEGHRPRDDP